MLNTPATIAFDELTLNEDFPNIILSLNLCKEARDKKLYFLIKNIEQYHNN